MCNPNFQMLHFHKILDFKLKLSLTGNLRIVKWYRGGEPFTGNMTYSCFTLKKKLVLNQPNLDSPYNEWKKNYATFPINSLMFQCKIKKIILKLF